MTGLRVAKEGSGLGLFFTAWGGGGYLNGETPRLRDLGGEDAKKKGLISLSYGGRVGQTEG